MRLHYKFPAQTCPATKTSLFVAATIKNSKSATKPDDFVADLNICKVLLADCCDTRKFLTLE